MWVWVPSHRVLTILPSIPVKALPSPTPRNEPASQSTELCLGNVIYPLSSPTASILGAIRYHIVLNISEFGSAQIPSTRDTCPLLVTHPRTERCTEREGVWGTGTLSVSVASISAHQTVDEWWDTPCTVQLHSFLLGFFFMARRTSSLNLYWCLYQKCLCFEGERVAAVYCCVHCMAWATPGATGKNWNIGE